MIVEVDGLDDLAFGGQPGQHILREKLCRGDLSGVERAVASATGRRRVRCSAISACRSSSQPISRSPTASRNAHRLQADAVQLARVRPADSIRYPVMRGDHRLQVAQRGRPAVARLSASSGRASSLSRNFWIWPTTCCQRDALVAGDLAEEEVLRLDRGGALVEGVDLGVADVLLDRVVLQEARTAERLQRFGQALVGAFGADALDDRQQQIVDPLGQLGVGAGHDRRPRVGSWWAAVYRYSARSPSA